MKPIYKQFIAILILMLPALIIPMIPGMSELLQYDRLAIADGEVWRLMTQHWCHWSMDHLFFDLFAFLILGLWAMQYSVRDLIVNIFISSLLISAGMLLWQNDQQHIRGLSGIDCALFAMVLFYVFKQAWLDDEYFWMTVSTLSMSAFIGKTIYELTIGQTLFMDGQAAGVTPLPLCHLIGFCCGLVIPLFKYSYKPKGILIKSIHTIA